jgi:hypothetical protein
MGTDKTEHSIQDCKDNIESFSKELNEFMSGNLVIGEGLDRLGQSVTEFRGTYTWVSRCDVNYQYSGIWNTPDAGAIITYESEALPDSTLQFKCATSPSSGTWKFHYEKGGETLIINYDLKRN